MYRIDKFLHFYNSLSGCTREIEKGVWVNSIPLPFYYGFFTKQYWRNIIQRIKDAKAVFNDKAVAVTWGEEVDHSYEYNEGRELRALGRKLKDSLSDLLDGLDANGDPNRCGLSEEEWEARINRSKTLLESVNEDRRLG